MCDSRQSSHVITLRHRHDDVATSAATTLGGDLGTSSSAGVIGSHVTRETGCGSMTSPWKLLAAKGRTIVLSLLELSHFTTNKTYAYYINNNKHIYDLQFMLYNISQ